MVGGGAEAARATTIVSRVASSATSTKLSGVSASPLSRRRLAVRSTSPVGRTEEPSATTASPTVVRSARSAPARPRRLKSFRPIYSRTRLAASVSRIAAEVEHQGLGDDLAVIDLGVSGDHAGKVAAAELLAQVSRAQLELGQLSHLGSW